MGLISSICRSDSVADHEQLPPTSDDAPSGQHQSAASTADGIRLIISLLFLSTPQRVLLLQLIAPSVSAAISAAVQSEARAASAAAAAAAAAAAVDKVSCFSFFSFPATCPGLGVWCALFFCIVFL